MAKQNSAAVAQGTSQPAPSAGDVPQTATDKSAIAGELLLTFTPQPVGLFEQNDIKVDSIAFSKYFICTRGIDSEGRNALRVYSHSGKCLYALADFRGPELAKLLQPLMRSTNAPDFRRVEDALRNRLNATPGPLFPPSEASHVTEKLKPLYNGRDYLALPGYGNRGIELDAVGAKTNLLLVPKALHGEPSGRYIIFEGAAGTIGLFDTWTEDRKAQTAENWNRVEWGDRTRLLTHLKQYPFLLGFANSFDGQPLPGEKHLASLRNDVLTIVQSSDMQRVYSDACNGYSCDPTNKSKLLYVNSAARTFNWVDLSKTVPGKASVESTPIPFEEDVSDMKFDPAGNFILCTVRSSDQKSSKLVVIDKASMKVVHEHNNVWGAITVDPVGTIYYVDESRKLRVVSTNLATIPTGGVEELREQARKRAAGRLTLASTVTLPSLPEGIHVTPTSDVETIESAIPKTLLRRFEKDINATTSIVELDTLEARFSLLRTSEDFAGSPGAFSLVDTAVQEKRNTLAVQELSTQLDELLKESDPKKGLSTAAALKGFDGRLATLRKQRAQVAIADPSKREEVDAKLDTAVKARTSAYSKLQGRLAKEIEDLATGLTTLIQAAGSPEEIYTVVNSENYQLHVELVNSVEDKAERARYRGVLSAAMDARIKELEAQAAKDSLKDAELAQEQAEQAAQMLERLKTAASSISSQGDLKKFQTSPLLAAFNRMTLQLSGQDQNAAQASVATLLQQAGARAAAQATIQKVKATGGQITIGKQRFAVAGEYSPIVKQVTENDAVQLMPGQLMFKDGFGRTYTSKLSTEGIAVGSAEHRETCERAFKEAVSHFLSLGRKVPEMRPTWRMTQHTEECLEKIIRELNIQREAGQGILILEGEAGTGKNVLIDILASLAKYERFMFACNYQTQKEDFTYEFAFSPDKGTYRVSAKLLEKLQTPYCVNAFDEINTLPPGVLKMLNALLDERRALFLADGREIPMDPTGLLVGFMNPRNYVGTQELSREVISRASIVTIPYPPLKRNDKDGEFFAPDEAIMIAHLVPGLEQFSQAEFESIWDAEINKRGTSSVQITNDQRRMVQGLHGVIKIADAVRKQYALYQTNVGTQQMDFVFCLRTTSSIARRLTPDTDAREVVKEVVLPKASDPETRKNLEFLIAQT
jgi:hypothetical protein